MLIVEGNERWRREIKNKTNTKKTSHKHENPTKPENSSFPTSDNKMMLQWHLWFPYKGRTWGHQKAFNEGQFKLQKQNSPLFHPIERREVNAAVSANVLSQVWDLHEATMRGEPKQSLQC